MSFSEALRDAMTEEMDRVAAYYGERGGGFWVALREAKLVGMDRESDLAVIRIERTGSERQERAAAGLTASPNSLEADRGFFRAAGGGYDAAAIALAHPEQRAPHA